MSVDKKIKYDMQGGVRNYLGKQKQVKAPLKWQSSPDHPTTELAYITQAEKDLLVKQDLHGSLNGGVNRGPSGIMSLNGFGSNESSQNVGGGDISSAETGGGRSGMSQSDANDFRSAAINAGAGQRVNPGFFDSVNVISPEEVAMAKDYRNQNNIQGTIAKNAYNKTRGGFLGNFISGGGITGGIIKGLGQMFGLGKNYNEPTYDMSGINTRVYENIPGVSTNPDYYNNLDNELMLSTEATPQNTFDADTFDDTVGSSNRFMLPFEGARTIIPNPNFTGELGYEQPNIEFGGTVLKDDNNKFNRTFNINDIASLIEASKQPQGIMGIDVGQDNIAFENDLMAKLSTKGMIEYNKLKKKKLQNKATDGLTPAPTPEELDRLNELEIQKNEAALNTTAIV